MKAPFSYFGGKMKLAPLIASLMPSHRSYIEPFFGSGAVLFAKRPARHEIINDVNPGIVAFFTILRDRPEELERVCRLTPYARQEFEQADVEENAVGDLELARRFWCRVSQSFTNSDSPTPGWSVSTAPNSPYPQTLQSRIDRFAGCAARLSRCYIESLDAVELIERHARHHTVIYADPPYLKATRSSRGPAGAPKDYRHDVGMEDDHRRLAKCLENTPAAVILSGYPSELYDEIYAGWWTMDIPQRALNFEASNKPGYYRAGRTERLWSNRDLDAGQLRIEAG